MSDTRRTDETPLSGPSPDDLDDLQSELMGQRPQEDQSAIFDASEIEREAEMTRTDVDQGALIADDRADADDSVDSIDVLTDLELREGETDNTQEAVQEGLTYIPPTDPPTVPSSNYDGAEIGAGMGASSLDEPYDTEHPSSFLPDDDDMVALVRDALRADSSTTAYADRVQIGARNGVVTLRGTVDDLTDSDNLLAVAEYVSGVTEVIDELQVRGLE